MRLTVTPIGATGSSTAAVSAAVVDYLEGERGDPGVALLGTAEEGAGGAGAYYADSGEGPGRWLGAGAEFQHLVGTVDRDAFQRVLEGRHPMSGARLVTARGSSQRGHLAVGTAARFDNDGQALYCAADVARLLGLRRRDVEELVDAGRRGGGDPADRSWIATAGPEGAWIPDREVTRHLELAAHVADADTVLAGGDPDELLSVRQVALLLGVTPRYVQRLCAEHPETPEARHSRQRASLPSVRGGDGALARYRVRRRDAAAFAASRKPPVARVGFDVTLTCEKSLAVVAMLAGPDRQAVIVRALRAANDTAVAHLDRVASTARRGGRSVGTEGLVVASYFHATSRALDPHPHFHNVVANAVVDDHGEVRTLDARALYRHAPAAAALATAAARWELRGLGLGWRRRDDGVWEIDGVTDAVIREFSRRRTEMDEVRAMLEASLGRPITHAEEDTVALSTRSAKEPVDPIGLVDEWRQRARTIGFDVDTCFDAPDRVLVYDKLPPDRVARLFADLADPDIGLCSGSVEFDRGDVIGAIVDWAPVDAGGRVRKVLLLPDEIERLADRFCASDLVVQLDPRRVGGVIRRRDGTVVDDGQDEPIYTTVELLEVETEILAVHQRGLRAGAGTVSNDLLDRIVAGDGRLSDEQIGLVRDWCTSGHRVQAAVGQAGTGKTTTMRVAAAAWRAAGYRVIGAAVKGEAARQLATDAGIEADTVALLLARADAGQWVLDSRTVLIIDEAATIGDRDLAAVLRLAETTGATVRLIGDPAQHGSVLAGGSFAHLAATTDTPELTTVRRLADRGERQRAELVRAGRVELALDQLQTSGQLVLTDSDAATYTAMLTRWYQHRQAGEPHPMVHGRNRQRRMLNQLAQAVLAADSTIDTAHAVVTSDGLRLCVGDDVIARHGDRSLHPPGNPAAWLRNGTTGRIVAVHHGDQPDKDRVVVHTAGGRLDCSRAVFDRRRGGLDLGYAVTSYAVQGSTRIASTSAVTATTGRAELYVDITRGTTSNQLYATRTTASSADETHLPRLDPELIPTLRHRLARGTPRTALAADPDALLVARLRRGRGLAALMAAQRRGEPGPIVAAIDRTGTAIRRSAHNDPPPGLAAALPRRPRCPHLAERWDALAGDIAVHLASTPPPDRAAPRTAPLHQTLGPRPDGDQGTTWDEHAGQLVHLAVDITLWHLNCHGDTTVRRLAAWRPGWLTRHLERLGRQGQLVDVDHHQLGQLLADVHAWRVAHGLTGTDEPSMLGPPADRASRYQSDRLARSIGGRHDNPGRALA